MLIYWGNKPGGASISFSITYILMARLLCVLSLTFLSCAHTEHKAHFSQTNNDQINTFNESLNFSHFLIKLINFSSFFTKKRFDLNNQSCEVRLSLTDSSWRLKVDWL